MNFGLPLVDLQELLDLSGKKSIPDLEKITLSGKRHQTNVGTTILARPEYPINKFDEDYEKLCAQSEKDASVEKKLCVPQRFLRTIIRPSEAWLHQDVLVENSKGVLTEDVWNYMQQTNVRADGTISIGLHTFKVHMVCMRIYAKYFSKYPYTVSFEFSPDIVPPIGFQLAYNWMRFDHYKLDACEIVPTLQVAVQLQIVELEHDLWRILNDDVFYDEYAYYTFKQSLQFKSLKPLCHLMVERIHRYVLLLVSKREFTLVDADLLQTMIGSKYCGVNTEVEALYIVLYWINSDFPNNFKHMKRLMKYVRFGYMPCVFIEDLMKCLHDDNNVHKAKISRLNNRALITLLQEKYTKQLFDAALTFSTLLALQDVDENYIREQCKRSNIRYYDRRYYIRDPYCKYHQSLTETNFTTYPTYDDFLTHIDFMESKSEKYPKHMESTMDDKYFNFEETKLKFSVKKPNYRFKTQYPDGFKKEIVP